ncbi:MAG TPA: nucleotide sugar dehydrogenase, partial [Gemmatimonadaceae bacterium]|nr:nucleotide sugar dehydrogenase [Gemmatimonadaceae bacterium]
GLLELLREQIGKQLHVSTGMPEDGDVFIISVGTPVGAGDNGAIPHPRLTELQDSARQVGEHLTPGSLVILRSTVPVGTTREVVLPLLEAASGLEGGTDFHLAFAPERTAEGRALKELRSLPQLIGGVNQDSTEAAAALFRELTPNIVRMESCEAAELAKLINNCFRDVIFAFSNEIARIAAPFNLDVVEVINAANRGYPRDPVPLPSPGVGGPCLTKDPYIFASMASRAGVPDGLSVRSRRINEDMHGFVATRILQQLTELGKDPKQCTLLLCGLAFKGQPETGDLRNSSGLEIARLLAPRVGRLLGHDPVASPDDIAAAGLTAAEYPADATKADAVLFLNNHPSYATSDVFELVRSLRGPALIFDGWHLFRPDDVIRAAPCVYMGLGFTRSSVAQPARS